jgi:uncharacterized protein (TIGR02246 family)
MRFGLGAKLRACWCLLLLIDLRASAQTTLSNDEAAVRAVIQKVVDAINRRDSEAVSAFYAPDADRIDGTAGTYAKGRIEIAAMYRKLFERMPPGATARFEYRVRFIRPDVALVDGTAYVSTGAPFTLVMTNDDGQWRLAAGRQGRVP